MRPRSRRRSYKLARLPVAHAFAERLAALRRLHASDPSDAGDQALKLIEEYLEHLANAVGYTGEGSMRRYSSFLRGREIIDLPLLDRVDAYTDARNCLAHTYGLQTTSEFADELIDFLAALLHTDTTAEQLMTSRLRTVAQGERLLDARDLMLSEGYGRLPVVQPDGRVIGLLTERDVVAAQAQAERGRRTLSSLHVADALPDDARARIAFVAPGASRADVLDRLRDPAVTACLVTPDGRDDLPPIGIITHADLLYR